MRARVFMILVGAVAVAGIAFGAGVAFGSGSSGREDWPPKRLGGPTPVDRGTPKPTLPKSQAYVHFRTNGEIIPPSKKVVAVHRLTTGTYCVELAPSIHVSTQTFAYGSIDYVITPTYMVTVQQNSDQTCIGHGYDNSVPIFTIGLVGGGAQFVDAAVYLTVP